MLTKEEAKKIALNECIAMVGIDIVEKYKDNSGCFYDLHLTDCFHFGIGLSWETDNGSDDSLINNETPFDIYACVEVNINTGKVTRDYKNSVLPKWIVGN